MTAATAINTATVTAEQLSRARRVEQEGEAFYIVQSQTTQGQEYNSSVEGELPLTSIN